MTPPGTRCPAYTNNPRREGLNTRKEELYIELALLRERELEQGVVRRTLWPAPTPRAAPASEEFDFRSIILDSALLMLLMVELRWAIFFLLSLL